ncbi:MAG: hypothetical protein AAGG11_18980 [Pseudomonadota bacterium]
MSLQRRNEEAQAPGSHPAPAAREAAGAAATGWAAPASISPDSRGRVATALRWLGALAVLVSGLQFLLDGLDLATDGWRHWVPPLAMLLFAGGAVGTARGFRDAKGARLLLALGLMLVSAQFAQLGGMLLERLVPGAALTSAGTLLPSALVGWGELAAVAALSLAATAWISIIALKTFAGAKARPLAGLFVLQNLLLLIPPREGVGAVVVLGLMAVTGILARRLELFDEPRFSTWEGRGLLTLLALPFAIGLVRFGFYVDSANGVALLLGTGALLTSYLVNSWWPQTRLGTGLETCALLTLGGAWSLFAAANFSFGRSGLGEWAELTLWCLPLLGYWLERGYRAPLLAPFDRVGQVLSGLLASSVVLIALAEADALVPLFSAFTVAAALLVWAIARGAGGLRSTAILLLTLVGVRTGFLLLLREPVDLWLAGGVLGFALVVGAGLLERRSPQKVAPKADDEPELSVAA